MVVAMTDSYRDLHGDAYREWKQQATDDYVQGQRQAFLAGFEAAAAEGQQFHRLRTWLKEQRDAAKDRYDETDDFAYLHRRDAFLEVLVKLSEMGNLPDEDGGQSDD